MTTHALVIAAPGSGAGKTLVSLAIMAALRGRGIAVRAAKSGPDYIDPAFHAAATGAPSVNLDAWAMAPGALRARAVAQGGEVLIIEGAMGVLDGAADGSGSAGDLAAALGAPVVLVVDIAKAGPSAALPIAGLAAMRPDIDLAGVILNRSGSARHGALARSLLPEGIAVFGTLPRVSDLTLPERHLGLVQAGEHGRLGDFLARAANWAESHLDLDALLDAARPMRTGGSAATPLPPLGQRIAVARDVAFAFSYPHMLAEWHDQGAEVLPFSPLADEGPAAEADAVFLPGGYPELHAGQLANASGFRRAMAAARDRGAVIYGECGGYMTLGEVLVDADGQAHEMLGFLPLETSFAARGLSLGYRRLTPLGGPFGGALVGHEFHYATILREGAADRMFAASDATGERIGDIGLVRGAVSGSFAHVIGPAPG